MAMAAPGAHTNDSVEQLLTMAQTHAAQGQIDDARDCLQRALEMAPQIPSIRLYLGMLEEMAGLPDQAERNFLALVETAPNFPPGHEALARSQIAQGKPEQAEASCRRGLAAFPGFPQLHATYGNLLQSLGRLAEAEGAYLQALNLGLRDAGVLNNLGLTRKQAGDLEGALEVLEEARQQAPEFQPALLNLSDTLTRLGRPAEAAAVCRDCLDRNPRNGTAVAFMGLALRDAGDIAAADRLVDRDLVRLRQPECPPEFPSLDAFHAALTEEVVAVPSRPSEPGTEDGRQTRELFPPATPALTALRSLFDGAVRDYAATVAADPTHPFLSHIPDGWRLKSWATLMRRVSEPEITHLHPDSWLSGVYYPQLPAVVGNSDGQEGWLEFGRPPFNLHHTAEPPIDSVQPQPGMLVLFPGYMFHRIRPFESETVRISIAFDAIPA